MCDGQFRVMQNYLREQRDNIISVNVVGEVALFIQHFYQDINVETMELVHLILQTLIEMCVGNYPNQLVIFNRQILDALNQIFQLDISDAAKRGYTIEDVSILYGMHMYVYSIWIRVSAYTHVLTQICTHTHTVCKSKRLCN